MKLDVRVDYATRRAAPGRTAIARWASAAASGLRRAHAAVGVRIVAEAESAGLNQRYRGRRGPTNVLAFPFDAPRVARSRTLGDLVICAAIVNREARRQGKPAASHWAHIVVHGIMHLRGYDHATRREAAAMERKEAAVLRRLGYADPYL
jgi:probable rRNA maturation factor